MVFTEEADDVCVCVLPVAIGTKHPISVLYLYLALFTFDLQFFF
jgi:hypothetical protein